MTFEQFCEEVRELNLAWKRDKEGHIRCPNDDCPLVALQKTRGKRGVYWNPQLAAANLGLPASVAIEIARISDNAVTPKTLLRRQLLEALGITKKRARRRI